MKDGFPTTRSRSFEQLFSSNTLSRRQANGNAILPQDPNASHSHAFAWVGYHVHSVSLRSVRPFAPRPTASSSQAAFLSCRFIRPPNPCRTTKLWRRIRLALKVLHGTSLPPASDTFKLGAQRWPNQAFDPAFLLIPEDEEDNANHVTLSGITLDLDEAAAFELEKRDKDDHLFEFCA